MRSTKYEWFALRRWARSGGYDPNTGDTNPIIIQTQDIWVKAFYRPDGTGNEFVPYVLDAKTGWAIYNELNLGKFYLREIPKWPPMYNPYTGTRIFPANVWVWVDVARPNFDADSNTTRFNWVKIQGNFNATVGTRFNKHYEAKLASLTPDDVLAEGLAGAPAARVETVNTFEQAEARLRTVLSIADGQLNPKE